jgi:anti-sigma B factor antagonist
MAMEFTIEPSSDPILVHLTGRLTLGPQLGPFGRQVAAAIASRRPTAVLLDVGKVEEVDSSGLGELVVLYTTAGQHQCRLCLIGPSPRVLRLLETTKLSGLLPHFDSRAEALRHLRPQ